MSSVRPEACTPVSCPTEKQAEPALRICCACPETKKIRDECMFAKGEEFCKKEIATHNECLRKLGFKVFFLFTFRRNVRCKGV